MASFEDEPSSESVRLERRSMAWPPSDWERDGAAWRDDLPVAPDPFTPYDPTVRPPDAPGPPPASAAGHGWVTMVREVGETIVLTALIFLGIRLVIQNFRIEGRSMEPTLHSGQYLLVNKMAYRGLGAPSRGDIVVFEAWGQDKDFIKRIVGVPGERIEIKGGCVYVDDACTEEPYLDQATTDAIGPVSLGEDEYYVLGDNRGNSSDSRAYGPLPGDRIIGKAWLTYWPPDEIGLVPTSAESFASGD